MSPSEPAISVKHIVGLHTRRWLYPIIVVAIYGSWLSYMIATEQWHLYLEFWQVALTMVLGSFAAGATAGGGAAVAFPVFTKVPHIPSPDARTFGLMIQSIGMTTAGVIIFVRRIKILPHVVLWVSLGGILGQIFGTYILVIPDPFPKILFTFAVTSFGVALGISRWVLRLKPRDGLPGWGVRYKTMFFAIGVFGGAVAAIVGAGIDMATFTVLTLAFGINEKISTPTTVTIMGLNSVVGFFLHGMVSQDIGIVWSYWLVAIPVVIIGAPLGAIAASRVQRDHLIIFLLTLIAIELVTTIWLVPFTTASIVATLVAVLLCTVCFTWLLRYRQRRVSGALID